MPIIDLQDFLKNAHEKYSRVGAGYDAPYGDCVRHREVWDNLSKADEKFVREIALPFLNKWGCRLTYECAPQLATALNGIEKELKPMRELDIASADFLGPLAEGGKPLVALIDEAAGKICQVRAAKRTVGFTATSKLLHMCIPAFFVMSDDAIRLKYGCEGNEEGYGNFMLRMGIVARDLMTQAGGDTGAICKHDGIEVRFAKLLDQYNYAITRRAD